MVCKSIHALADGLSLHDAASFSGHDWDGWDRMRRADRNLALPLVASITPDLQAALGGIRASLESRIDQVPDWIANTDMYDGDDDLPI